jgi:general secretion pathway protein G
MRYRLSTLMIALAIVPPVVAGIVKLRPRTIKNTNEGAAYSTITMLHSAVQFYSLQVKQLPPDLDALLQPPPDLSRPSRWRGPYLKEGSPPIDPWGDPYRYEILDATQGRVRIWSTGRDGKSGTADDVSIECDDMDD